jgi:uncharacterized protein (DUF58 family)
MRLTRRGWTVVVAVLVAVAMSWGAGPRALNAVVVPLIVVLAAGLVSVGRVDRPRVERHPVPEGHVGDERSVTVTIEAGRSVVATVRDTVGDGLSPATEPVAERTLEGEETFGYDLRLERRGRRRVGPLSIVVSDVFGLATRRFEYEATTTLLVYPAVHDLGRGPAADVRALAGLASRHDREEFDQLREYRRGDPLRDVHWKTVAKRPDDLFVAEYADDDEGRTVTIAAEGVAGRDDEMASAAATVATALLELDAAVGITVPDGTQPPGRSRAHRRELLGLLAVAGAGDLPTRTERDADVLIRADDDGTTVVVDGREIPFERLLEGGTDRDSAGDGRAKPDGTDRRGVTA